MQLQKSTDNDDILVDTDEELEFDDVKQNVDETMDSDSDEEAELDHVVKQSPIAKKNQKKKNEAASSRPKRRRRA